MIEYRIWHVLDQLTIYWSLIQYTSHPIIVSLHTTIRVALLQHNLSNSNRSVYREFWDFKRENNIELHTLFEYQQQSQFKLARCIFEHFSHFQVEPGHVRTCPGLQNTRNTCIFTRNCTRIWVYFTCTYMGLCGSQLTNQFKGMH